MYPRPASPIIIPYGVIFRAGSPPGGSMRTTSAPISASREEANSPAKLPWLRSRTSRPSRASGFRETSSGFVSRCAHFAYSLLADRPTMFESSIFPPSMRRPGIFLADQGSLTPDFPSQPGGGHCEGTSGFQRKTTPSSSSDFTSSSGSPSILPRTYRLSNPNGRQLHFSLPGVSLITGG